MLFGTFVVIHVLVSIFLVLVVLLQAGKGGGMGVAFGGGGGGGTVLGAGGAPTLLGKATVAAGAIFMITSMTLAYLSSTSRSVVSGSVVEQQDSITGEEKPEDGAGAGAGAGATPDKGDDKATTDSKGDDKAAPASDKKAEEAPKGDDKAAPKGDDKAAPSGDGPPNPADVIPGAVVKENPDGTGTVEFDLVKDPETGEMKAVAPGAEIGDDKKEAPKGDDKAAPKGDEKKEEAPKQ